MSIENTGTTDLLFRQEGFIAFITLNRPQKLNTLTPEMGKKLRQISEEINADDSVRVVILEGTGEKAFSAGSDIKALDDYGTNWQLRNRIDYAKSLFAIRKPVIASIRGYCIGGGLELALMSDIRISDTTGKFGAGEIKLGWLGGAGNTQLLPRLVGYGKAAQMLFTGDYFPAEEAHRCGLVQEVVAPEKLSETVIGLAQKIANNAPIGCQLIKHLIRVSEGTTMDMGLSYENDLFTYCFTTKDHLEGISAFKEKRPPQFKGE